MRVLITLSAIIALMALAGCNSTDKVSNTGAATTRSANTTTAQQQQAQNVPADGARRITTFELNEALNRGEAIVVDVRNDAAYRQARIKGAILIPVSEIANRLNELPRDKMIVTYCS
jgi:predicted sulfurtransferase